MPVGFLISFQGTTMLDFTLTSATNITQDAAQPVPGYDSTILLAIVGILVAFLWKKRVASCKRH